jgi:exosortase/archaeosortase family protein
MIVGLAVAALYGELQRDSWRTRLAQLALMAALALVANWVRVYTVIEAGYLTDMQSYLVRVSHYGFGWCVFAVALVIFLWLANRFGPEPGPEPDYAALESAAKPPTRLELIGFVGALVILLALPAASAGLRALHPSAALTAAAVVDPREPWSWATLDPHTAWAPRVGGADKQQHQAFFSTAGDTLEMYAAAIGVQRQGAELVGESTNLVGDRLDVRAEQVVGSAAGAFREAEVVDQTQAASLIWWRYEAAGQVFVVPLAEQLWYGIKATVSRPPARLIALRAPCTGGCDNARRVMSAFMTSGSVR